ncbi:unnamed protein product [Vitrella brassicaformis CCMP3155]|uniref:Polysaccharide biosynthesis protein C-terminal domain-containing protein n=2 Tax=Vitrella brassicaformis TaxID=1169539 RepID=A0A0G4F346_VITBC|nr:unnamed protein product [Vitrella brassicaformis CCMP3155]|eukprot:CEM05823.1 unnamed protein product [Vitrella brassicaformis CCMP3155]
MTTRHLRPPPVPLLSFQRTIRTFLLLVFHLCANAASWRSSLSAIKRSAVPAFSPPSRSLLCCSSRHFGGRPHSIYGSVADVGSETKPEALQATDTDTTATGTGGNVLFTPTAGDASAIVTAVPPDAYLVTDELTHHPAATLLNVPSSDAVDASAPPVVPSFGELLLFMLNVMLIWIQDPLMSLIDTAAVGRVDAVQLAALGPATQVVDSSVYLFGFLGIATTNLYATTFAQQQYGRARRVISTSLWISSVVGVALMTALLAFTSPILSSFTSANAAAVLPAAQTYVRIRALSVPFALLMMCSKGALLALKDTRTPFLATLASSVTNLIGDFVGVFVLKRGIAGAAWATAVAQGLASIILASQLLKRTLMLGNEGATGTSDDEERRQRWAAFTRPPNVAEMRQFLAFFGPCFLQFAGKVSFYGFMTHVASVFGAISLAAHQVTLNLYQCFCPPCDALSQTAQAYLPKYLYTRTAEDDTDEPQDVSASSVALSTPIQTRLLQLGAVSGVLVAVGSSLVSYVGAPFFTNQAGNAAVAAELISTIRHLSPWLGLSLLLLPLVGAGEGILLAMRQLAFIASVYTFQLFAPNSYLYLMKRLQLSQVASGIASLGLNAPVTVATVWRGLCLYQVTRLAFFLVRLYRKNMAARKDVTS